MSMRPTIDEELRDYLPPHTDAERDAHRAAIMATKRADRPIVVWRETGFIVDGHHTYLVCEENDFPYDLEMRSFPSREAAKEWMRDRQTARRNMTADEVAARAALDGRLVKPQTALERMAATVAQDERGLALLAELVIRHRRTVKAAYCAWKGRGAAKAPPRRGRIEVARGAFLVLSEAERAAFLVWAKEQ